MDEKNPTFSNGDLYSVLGKDALPPNTVDLGDGSRLAKWESLMEEKFPSGLQIKEKYDASTNYENLHRHKRPKKRCKSRASVTSGFNLSIPKSQRRAAKLTVPSSNARFETFIPLRQMWTSYIGSLLHVSSLSESNYMSASAKLMKADLHGCPLIVQKSKCPSYIGVSGIMIQETRNMFVLITRSHQVRSIPKSNSIFSVVLGKFVFSIHGNQFIVEPGNRSSKKFKTKASIDL